MHAITATNLRNAHGGESMAHMRYVKDLIIFVYTRVPVLQTYRSTARVSSIATRKYAFV